MPWSVTSSSRPASRAAGAVLAAGLAFGLLAGLAPGTAAAAPGDSAIAEARAEADALTERIGILASRLSRAEAEVEAAHAASAIALDTFQATQDELRAAEGRAVEAQAAAKKATADLGVARGDVVDFARQSYMDGSSFPGAAALITAGSPGELIERAALLEAAGAHRSDVLLRVTDLQEEAARADARAEVAVAEAKTLKQQAATALARASEAEQSAREKAASVTARRAEVAAELGETEAQLARLVGAQQAAERARQQQQAAARPEPAPPPPAAPPSSGGDDTPAGPGSESAAQTAIDAAMQHLGLSYAWGGGGSNGPGWGWGIDQGVWGFDCSGLTQYAYAQAGIDIPRNSRAQYAALPKVSSDSLRAGDLVFWATTPSNPQTIHHVAIYLGDGRIIEAPQSGDVVKISPMRWYHYAGAVRPSA
jgi:cell wall-associated NlpC family hydrolase